ncbi:hypothetical protein BGZ65_011591 [Modicella reniformis]|uniref:Uncharacterized protein n=1 Tax=Modicella reniformis TaxID=1440133 RepID=A0A9P6MAR3_9FUNG|nr:hypothetical protein BGZ65_011591 [Modicella reniformis]
MVSSSKSELKSGNKVFLAPTDRNKEIILEQLRPFLDSTNYVLEVGSGSGQHIYHFAKEYPQVVFQPTEYDTSLFSSIEAYTADLDAGHNVLRPIELDATKQEHWKNIIDVSRQERGEAETAHGAYDLVISTNIFHIASWEVGSGVVRGAGQILRPGGFYIAYGAFKRNGKFSTESNAQFDQTLRGRNPDWGVRDIEAIQMVAEEEARMTLVEIRDMPSNNYMLIFQKIDVEE